MNDFRDLTASVSELDAAVGAAALAHSLADAGAVNTIASRDAARASKLANVCARLSQEAGAVAAALGGTWTELASTAAHPHAVPDSEPNGGFLRIDDLYRRSSPLPAAYINDAETLIAHKTDEYMAWFDRSR